MFNIAVSTAITDFSHAYLAKEPMMEKAKDPYRMNAELPAASTASAAPDSGALASLRAEIEELKKSTISRETHERLQQDLNATKAALEAFKKDTLKKLLDLMKEVCVLDIYYKPLWLEQQDWRARCLFDVESA